MLETLDLERSLTRKQYKARLPTLQARLHQLQRVCWKGGWSPIILFEGWPIANRGKVIRKLTERLEPRGFDVHWLRESRSHHRSMPAMWRFWRRLPNHGSFAIFDGSWYRRVTVERSEANGDPHEVLRAFQDIVEFERTITDDRYGLVKLFLHLDADEYARRIERLESTSDPIWQAEEIDDWSRQQTYESQLDTYEEMLERTETEWGPWALIKAHDLRWTRIRVMEVAIERIEAGLSAQNITVPEPIPLKGAETAASDPSALSAAAEPTEEG